jgi:hypothetical protein
VSKQHTFPCHTDDFCIIHGSEFMRSEMGNPIPFCQACDDEAAAKIQAAVAHNFTVDEMTEYVE